MTIVENLRGKDEILTEARANFYSAVYQNLPLPLYWTVTGRILDRGRAGLQVVALGRRDIVWGVSDYGAFRGHSGEAAKGNPDSVPICVTMFFNQGRVVTKGI